MRPFSLEEYLKDPSRKVVTREGGDVRIICTDKKGDCPIVALIKKSDGYSEVVAAYSKNGVTNEPARALYDLFFAPEKHEGWVNIFKFNNYYHTEDELVYNSKKEAEMEGKKYMTYIATVKIEWEE